MASWQVMALSEATIVSLVVPVECRNPAGFVEGVTLSADGAVASMTPRHYPAITLPLPCHCPAIAPASSLHYPLIALQSRLHQVASSRSPHPAQQPPLASSQATRYSMSAPTAMRARG